MEYSRLSEVDDSSSRRYVLFCIPWGHIKETDQEKLARTMVHLKGSIQDMHVKILSQNQHITKHREKGIEYLNKDEDALAESEARLLLHSLELKQVYIDVKEKMILLHKELGKVTTLAACAQVLQQSSDVLGRTIENHLNVASIDQTMERLESQLHKANHAQRAMAEPLKRERVREVLELRLPDLDPSLHRASAVQARVQVQVKEGV
jgi:hypothetical protein